MAFDAHKNFAVSTVATAPSPATSGTSLVVAAGEGARFPTVPFNAAIWPANTLPTPANAEIVRVTARSTDTLTITRTQESTSARTVTVGDQIAAVISAKTVTDIEGMFPVSVANGGTGATTLTSNNVLLGNGTSAVQFVAPGTSGNVLTSNGTTWQSTAPSGGGNPVVPVSSLLENVTSSRFDTSTAGSGTVSQKTYGLEVSSGTTASSYSLWRILRNNISADIYARNPYLSFHGELRSTASADADSTVCYGSSNSNGTTFFPAYAFGFQGQSRTSGNGIYGYASNNGTATFSSLTGAQFSDNCYYAKMTSGTNVKFYVDGSLKATITTNLPTNSGSDTYYVSVSAGNRATTAIGFARLYYLSFGQDAY